jgi:hypothetical protein
LITTNQPGFGGSAVHLVDNTISHCYLIVDKELTLIDTGFPFYKHKILRYITNILNRKPSELKTIILTHGDIDHSGNALRLKKITGASIAIHEKDADVIARRTARIFPTSRIGFLLKFFNIDFKIFGATPESPELMDVVLVAAKKDIINDYVSVIIEAGLNPIVIDVDAFAIENMLAVNYEVEKDETVAMANVGASITNINILKVYTFLFQKLFALCQRVFRRQRAKVCVERLKLGSRIFCFFCGQCCFSPA